MKYNNPLPRLILTSPYPVNSKEELDMRRKAEVLKHQGPQKSTQMNTLTKNQQFAQVVRGFNPTQKAMRSSRYSLEQISYCDSSNNRTPSSSSDVPGKPMLLYLDQSIPLYNYANEYRTYSDLPRPIGEELPWRFFSNDQATSMGVTETNIGTLQILRVIESDRYIFSIDIPINTTVSSVRLIVKYAGQEISYITPQYAYTSLNVQISDIILYTVDGFFYDFFVVAVNTPPDVPIDMTRYISLTGMPILTS
jgi:hypothetical protein